MREPKLPSAPDQSGEAIEASTDRSLRSLAVRGSFWTGGEFALRQGIRLGSNLILTRLLFPEAFGLMVIVNAFRMGLGMFSDLGIAAAIVQTQRGDEERFLNTAWVIQIARGLLLWVVMGLAAWPLSVFYEHPVLAQMIPVAALGVLVSGFNSMSLPRLRRRLALRTQAFLEMSRQFTSVLVMISWALIDPSVWSLVAGGLAGSVTLLLASHTLERDRKDRFSWDTETARQLFGFGKWIFFATILTFLAQQSDRLVFGKLIPVDLLGVYSIAAMLAALAGAFIDRIGSFVVFPFLSHKNQTGGDIGRAFDSLWFPLIGFGGLIVSCIFVAGRPLVELLYDPRYSDAGWILQILAVGSWLEVLQVPIRSALLALGLPRLLVLANGVKLIGLLTLLPLGYSIYGFPGALIALVAAEALRYGTLSLVARHHRLGMISLDLVASACLFLAAGAGSFAGRFMFEAGPLFTLVASGVVAASSWLVLAYVFARRRGIEPRRVFRLS